MANMEFTGFEAFENTLSRIPILARSKVANVGLKQAGNVVAKAYRSRIHRGDPADTPDLRQLHKLISTKQAVYKNGTLLMAITGVRTRSDGEGWYANLVEQGYQHFGTKAHIPGKPALLQAQIASRAAMLEAISNSLAKALEAA